MRRKRLQHVADILCHMFCGWRQAYSKHALVALGNGQLEVDILTGKCRFEGKEIPPLPIVAELRGWMDAELIAHNIPATGILSASLRVALSFSEIPWAEKSTTSEYFAHGEPIRSGILHACRVQCESLVATEERGYIGKYADYEEWPVGWPAP